MTEKSFFEFYNDEKKKPTPAQVFVCKIAKLTHRSEYTVRQWLAGSYCPDELAINTIAKELGVEPNSLFPQGHKNSVVKSNINC